MQAVAVAVACWWLSPLDTRTVLAAASEYVTNTGYGPYDRIVFSHVHQRPFEQCPGAEERHIALLAQVAEQSNQAATALSEPRLLVRTVRLFNRATQQFYSSQCPSEWRYFYSYVDYQSWLMKVAPVIWVIDQLHLSEIYVVLALVLGSWVGIFSLFWLTKRLTGSALVGVISLVVLWFSVEFFGPGAYADFRLNLFNTFTLVAAAQFLCDLPKDMGRVRRWSLELSAALAFGVAAMLLMFLRLSPTRLDATVVMACLFAVAAVRWNFTLLRRAVLVLLVVTAVQWPYRTFSRELMAPVSVVDTTEAEEYKVANAVMFLTERPTHFGNFVLDFNFTWMFDADYYLRQLSMVAGLHHGFPVWGRQFLAETVFHHPMEIVNAWWKRFVIQVVYHDPMSYGLYRDYQTAGTVVLWIGVGLILFIVANGRALSLSWPLVGLVMWEVFGLHVFLAQMHVHAIYLFKGVPLLWCALPAIAVMAGRRVIELATTLTLPSWPIRPRWLALGVVLLAVAPVIGYWAVREYRKELHATNMWRAVHAGQYYRDAYLSPDALVGEVEAIRRLGGEDPGTVSMFGAWALFGFQERIGAYRALTGEALPSDDVKQLGLGLYRQALQEAPDNPHFYPYAKYFEDPEMLQVFREGLRRFPEHPYAAMMNYFVGTQDSSLPYLERVGYLNAYDATVRRQLRSSASYRPWFRESPEVSAPGVSAQTPDGVVTALLPGEIARVGPIHTLGTDRLTIGVYLKVTHGQLTVQLADQPGATLSENSVLTTADAPAYRAWHFVNLAAHRANSRQATTALELRAGPQGARFIIRDLYPVIENPRWYR